jgi:membrane protein
MMDHEHDANGKDGPATARPRAADVMRRDVPSCSRFSKLPEAALLLRTADLDVVPVLDEGKPVGIVTGRDLAQVVEKADLGMEARAVEDVMAEVPPTIPADADLDAVLEALKRAQGKDVVVVDESGRFRGIIAPGDLVEKMPGPLELETTADHRAQKANAARQIAEDRSRRWRDWLRPRVLWELLRDTASEWSCDKVPQLGAALAFYSILSLAPLLLIVIRVAGLAFGEEAARGEIVTQIRDLVGDVGAEAIQAVIRSAQEPHEGSLAAIVGIATLLVGASGVFGQLQDAMNTIWEVKPRPDRAWHNYVLNRFLSIAMVLGTGFLLLVSLLLSAALAALFTFAGTFLPEVASLLELGSLVTNFAVITVLFALIFKLLPDVQVPWRDVWLGASLTTALFLAGKGLISLYLGRSSFGSSYGAAGSLVVLVVWIYYSSQILFFGAEFTKVFARRMGERLRTSRYAEPVTPEARAHQGIPKADPGPAA